MHDIHTLRTLGWGPVFQVQLDPQADASAVPMRVAAVHRDALDLIGAGGGRRVPLAGPRLDEAATVGDWLLVERETGRPLKLLERKSLVQRRAAGTARAAQAIAANLDSLFIVSSCNADFNPARLERYLALAREAGVMPVVALTKADLCPDPAPYVARARALLPGLTVEAVNALDAASLSVLAPWCGPGETVALVGSSGVGKSTLVNALAEAGQATAGIREDDAHGRHTTTARSLHRMAAGGWMVDTPGMRALRLLGAADGVAAVFEDVAGLASGCRFADCAHEGEPGCAVQAAIVAGDLDPARLERWRKLAREEARNSASLAEQRRSERAFGRMARSAMAAKRLRRDVS